RPTGRNRSSSKSSSCIVFPRFTLRPPAQRPLDQCCRNAVGRLHLLKQTRQHMRRNARQLWRVAICSTSNLVEVAADMEQLAVALSQRGQFFGCSGWQALSVGPYKADEIRLPIHAMTSGGFP